MKQLAKYEPLMVTPRVDRHDETKVIAFLNGALCLFERGTPLPPAGEPVEVMITRLSYAKNAEGFWDLTIPVRSVSIQLVDLEKHVLVNHNGFECSGSMCATTAGVHGEQNPGLFEGYRSEMRGGKWVHGDTRYQWITPGRVGVREVSNVSAGRTWKCNRYKRMPGQVWLLRETVNGTGDKRRVEGVSSLAELMHGELIVAKNKTPGEPLWKLEVAEYFDGTHGS